MYNKFIKQLHMYAEAIGILAKGYLLISLITPLKLIEILEGLKATITKTNPDYDIVIKRLHMYYDMKLVTFGIDRNKNLIMQFLVSYSHTHISYLYCIKIETVPVPIIDTEHTCRFLHLFTGRQTIYCTKL